MKKNIIFSQRFCRSDHDQPMSLSEVIDKVKPTILIGLAGAAPNAFSEELIGRMTKYCMQEGRRPIIMALSNPTSKAECTGFKKVLG